MATSMRKRHRLLHCVTAWIRNLGPSGSPEDQYTYIHKVSWSWQSGWLEGVGAHFRKLPCEPSSRTLCERSVKNHLEALSSRTIMSTFSKSVLDKLASKTLYGNSLRTSFMNYLKDFFMSQRPSMARWVCQVLAPCKNKRYTSMSWSAEEKNIQIHKMCNRWLLSAEKTIAISMQQFLNAKFKQ